VVNANVHARYCDKHSQAPTDEAKGPGKWPQKAGDDRRYEGMTRWKSIVWLMRYERREMAYDKGTRIVIKASDGLQYSISERKRKDSQK